MNLITILKQYTDDGIIPGKYSQLFLEFYKSYIRAMQVKDQDTQKYEQLFKTFLELVKKQFQEPYDFEPYHKQVRAPFDYYQFGFDFLEPLVDVEHSTITGLKELDQMREQLKQKHNVILLANHQIEADPQAINVLLEHTHPGFAKDWIFVAGDRVVTDPLAIPFSMGLNLLCIFSKKHVDNPPEDKLKKQLHNKKTMRLLSELLSEGGRCIYVAPSGGRDRINAKGIVEVDHFDPKSIAMLHLMSRKAKNPTHFYTLTLATYPILPPPETVQKELGELRQIKGSSIHMAFGEEVDMDHVPGCDTKDKTQKRNLIADFLWKKVCSDYSKFPI